MKPEELEKLVIEFQTSLEFYAQQWTPHAGDVVQTAFLRLYESENPVENPKAWLFRTVRNLAIDQHRSDSRRKVREQVIGEQRVQIQTGSSFPIDSEELQAAIETIPLELREVLVGKIWGKLGFDELGIMLGIATSTAHRRYHLALETLQQKLEVSCPTKKTT